MCDDFFRHFHIGAYCLSPTARDRDHVREIAECGIDLLLSVPADRALLDLMHEHDICAIVSGVFPGWFGADGKNSGTMHLLNPLSKYRDAIAKFVDHPAIVGIDIGDEPSQLDFPHYGEIVRLLCEHLAGKLLYLNIYPSYGMLASAGNEQAERELGAHSYEEYLRAYCDNVPLPYLSIDHYAFSSSIPHLISDLAKASEIAAEYKKPLMTVLEVNSPTPDRFLSLDQLRIQAWCALAFGARSISWACYSPGWWYNNVLDKNGAKTEQYDKLKTVNAELRALTREYAAFTHLRTHKLAKGSRLATPLGTLSTDANALVGEFTLEGSHHALMCAPLDRGTKITLEGAPKDAFSRTASGISSLSSAFFAISEPTFVFTE